MDANTLVERALALGFANAAAIATADIPIVPGFRICCEDNTCGKYGINYACPPDCGSVEDMKRRLLRKSQAIVVQTMWQIDDPEDGPAIKKAKQEHTRLVRRWIDACGDVAEGFMVGASGCDLCQRCAIEEGSPCRFPQAQFCCMSAYCIYVDKLCTMTGMEYDSGPGIVDFFGMFVFDWK